MCLNFDAHENTYTPTRCSQRNKKIFLPLNRRINGYIVKFYINDGGSLQGYIGNIWTGGVNTKAHMFLFKMIQESGNQSRVLLLNCQQ